MGGICARMEWVIDIDITDRLPPRPLWRDGVPLRSLGSGWRHQRLGDRRRFAVRRFVLISNPRQLLPRLLSLALPVPHTGIKSAGCQKPGVSSALDDTALIQDNDLVGTHDRG